MECEQALFGAYARAVGSALIGFKYSTGACQAWGL
jgi:hypothetical protein